MNEAFIDGQNLRLGTTKASKPWKVDLSRFRIYLEKKYEIKNAYYFLGYYSSEHEKLYKEIQEAGFVLIFRKHNENMSSIKKGNVDTDIVFEIMRKLVEKEKFEKVFLVSGDGDYYKMVQFLILKGRFGKLLAPDEKRMSSLYRSLSPQYYAFLGQNDIRKKIGKRKKQKTGSA